MPESSKNQQFCSAWWDIKNDRRSSMVKRLISEIDKTEENNLLNNENGYFFFSLSEPVKIGLGIIISDISRASGDQAGFVTFKVISQEIRKFPKGEHLLQKLSLVRTNLTPKELKKFIETDFQSIYSIPHDDMEK